jgi:hypothetical protein
VCIVKHFKAFIVLKYSEGELTMPSLNHSLSPNRNAMPLLVIRRHRRLPQKELEND